MTTDSTKLAELNNALLDIKRIAGKSRDHDADPWSLLDLISDRVLAALGDGQTQSLQKFLPPNPDKLNADRAQWAGAALEEFRRATGSDYEDALGDLLCDLMHWSDRNNFDFDAALCRAQGHYKAETTPDATNLEE
jgi:hypothetical protein